MGWNSKDVYYDPEEFGLVPVAEVEWEEPCYSFDTTVVWKKEGTKNVFYWATDSGCSCPSPFEDYTSLDKCEKGTAAQACKALQDILNGVFSQDYAQAQVFEAISKIRAA